MNANSGWLFTPEQLEDTPSRRDGIDKKQEQMYRREGVKALWKIGISMKLTEQPTLSTACAFFHRFYMLKSFQEYPQYIAALGCLFLAGKVEDTPKKCKDICAVAKETFPEIYASRANLTNEVFAFERTLLSALGFDLYYENPYTYLVSYAKIFKLEMENLRTIVQFCWTFLNDCAGATICLQYDSEVIAIAILQLGLRFFKFEADNLEWEGKVDGVQWWDKFVDGLTDDMLNVIIHVFLDYYDGHNQNQSS